MIDYIGNIKMPLQLMCLFEMSCVLYISIEIELTFFKARHCKFYSSCLKVEICLHREVKEA